MKKFSFCFCSALFLICSLYGCKPDNNTGETTEIDSLQVEGNEPGDVYTNPVIDNNFPDPTVIKAHDGYYYVYATNTEVNGKTVNIKVARSNDLVDWEFVGDALPQKPSWAETDFWAPHVFYDSSNQAYFLYYSGEMLMDEITYQDGWPRIGTGVPSLEEEKAPVVEIGNL